MKLVLRSALAAFAAASTLGLTMAAAQAATPKDMLVMATLLDEFTTLDPGNWRLNAEEAPVGGPADCHPIRQ